MSVSVLVNELGFVMVFLWFCVRPIMFHLS